MTDKIIIVASGPSARGFTPNKTDAILQVNGQIDWLDRQDIL